jgi:hypothetical protein
MIYVPKLNSTRPLPSSEDRLVLNIEFEVGSNPWEPRARAGQRTRTHDNKIKAI